MSQVPDKCPFCESPVRVHCGNPLRSEDGGFATYECKTQIDVEWDDDQWRRVGQTDVCMIREIKLLTRQRNEAQERMNRLEEVGDDMHISCSDRLARRIWTAAKEDK